MLGATEVADFDEVPAAPGVAQQIGWFDITMADGVCVEVPQGAIQSSVNKMHKKAWKQFKIIGNQYASAEHHFISSSSNFEKVKLREYLA